MAVLQQQSSKDSTSGDIINTSIVTVSQSDPLTAIVPCVSQNDELTEDEQIEHVSQLLKRTLISEKTAGIRQKVHLSKLIVHNFKSYSGTVIIGPFSKGLNAVIGPNGSGKSNLMEAISFVLGVRATHLRGQNLSELIHESPEGKATHAKITLELLSDDDHSSKFEFARDIQSTGSSRYFVDGKAVKSDEYFENLARFGVLPRVRNCIVSQGEVESVGMKPSKELGELIDQMSGSANLKPQYEDLKRRIEVIDCDIKSAQFERQRFEAEKKNLKKQTEEIERYSQLEKQINDSESLMHLCKLYLNEVVAGQCRIVIDRTEEEKHSVECAISEIRDGLKIHEEKKCELDSKSCQLETELQAIVTKCSKQRTQVTRLDEQLKHKRCVADRMKTTLQKDNAKADNSIEELGRWRDEAQKLAKEYEIEKQLTDEISMQGEEKMSPKDREEFESLRRRFQDESVELRKSMAGLDSEKEFNIAQVSRIQMQIDKEQLGLREIEFAISNIKSRIKDLSQVNVNDQSLRDQLEAKEKELDMVLGQLRAKERSYRDACELVSSSRCQSRENEFETAKKLTLQTLQSSYPEKVFGRLIDLAKPTEKAYSHALTSALGIYADHIVVDSWETAKCCIDKLREMKCSVEDFLPLSNLTSSSVDDYLRSNHTSFRPAIDMLIFDGRFKRAFEMALDNTVIVKDLQTARKVAFEESKKIGVRLKVVTMAGEKILKNATFVADGEGQKKSTRFDVRASEAAEIKVRKVGEELNELKMAWESLKAVVKGLSDAIEMKRSDEEMRVIEKQSCDLQLESKLKQLKQTQEKLKELSTEMETCQQSISETQKQAKDMESVLDQLEVKIFKSFQSRTKISDLKALEWKWERNQEKKLERLKNFTKEQSRIESLVHQCCRQLSVTFPEGDLESLPKRIEECVAKAKQTRSTSEFDIKLKETLNEITHIGNSLGAAQDALSTLERGHMEANDSLKFTKSQIAQLVDEIRVATNNLTKAETTLHGLLEEIKAQKEAMERYDERVLELLQEALEQNYAIKLKSGIPLATAMRSIGDCCMEDGILTSQQTTIPDIDIDYSDVPRSLSEQTHLTAEKFSKFEDDQRSRIAKLKLDLNRMKPNLKAYDELRVAVKNGREVQSKIERLNKRKDKVGTLFKKYRTKRCELFMKCFTHTQRAVDSVYSRMTACQNIQLGFQHFGHDLTIMPDDSPWKRHFGDQSMGGRAYLELEEFDAEDTPFESGVLFHAIPANKQFQDIEMLSGGEKSLASLSLLFALHTYRPAPFFILDEVDAALDFQNSENVAQYLQSTQAHVLFVSLRPQLYSKADYIFGVYKDHSIGASRLLQVDMTKYRRKVNNH